MLGKDADSRVRSPLCLISQFNNKPNVFILLFAFLPTALSPGSNGEFVVIFCIELKLGDQL